MATTKTITIDGNRYRLTVRSWDGLLDVRGRGIRSWGIVLPAGVTLDSPDLREQITAAVGRHQRANAAASAFVQQAVRDGTAGLGRPA